MNNYSMNPLPIIPRSSDGETIDQGRGGCAGGQPPRQMPPSNASTGPRRPTCCQLHNVNPTCGLRCNGVPVQTPSNNPHPAPSGPPGFPPSGAHVFARAGAPLPAPYQQMPPIGLQAFGGFPPPSSMAPPHDPRNQAKSQRYPPAQRMPPYIPHQQQQLHNPQMGMPPAGYPAQHRLAMGYQQQGLHPSPAPGGLSQPCHPLPPRPPPRHTPTPPSFQQPAPAPTPAVLQHSAQQRTTYGATARDAEEDLSGPLSLAGLRDVSFSQPAAGSLPAFALPPPRTQHAGSPSPETSRQTGNSGPPSAWQQDTRKVSHTRFDLRLADLEHGMIVHLKPNATWGTGRHPGLVYAWKDAGYVEILVGTSFLGQGMVGKMSRIREAHERARIGKEYLKIGDRAGGADRDFEPAYAGLGLPVLRLRGGRALKKTTYFRFVYRFHCELTDICKYADGRNLKNKYVLDEQSWAACQAYLQHRMPLIKRAEAEVRRQQREADRAVERQRVQEEMRQKVSEAARGLSAVSMESVEQSMADDASGHGM